MPAPSELCFEEILKFLQENNGKVTNHDLVSHFKRFLMDPENRDEARAAFKKHVNTLANIKTQNNEKWLILKKKYQKKEDSDENQKPSSALDAPATIPAEMDVKDCTKPVPSSLPLNQDFNIINNIIRDSIPVSPSYSELKENVSMLSEDDAPTTPISVEKDKTSSLTRQARTSIPNEGTLEFSDIAPPLTMSRSESMLVEQKISVKERKQMFNRMASEGDVLKSHQLASNYNTQGVYEEDRTSLDQKSETDPLDTIQKQWILCAARGEYHKLAKMCKENPKLVKTKDPFTTAMHWACKRGDENLVKLLAGVSRHIVNERSGYSPLHIAMQFRRENVYRLLVNVYDADQNIRDWSGRKPMQYLVHMDTTLSPGMYRKAETFEAYTLGKAVTCPPVISINQNIQNMSKKEGFLRIGSLNVRVKKTTEAFSNFLGVGATRSSAYVTKSSRDKDFDRRSDDGEQLHKSWGSADNIQREDKLMPPPMSSKVRRRGATGRRVNATHSLSTPSTPDQPRARLGPNEEGDSDSDSAAGFHAAWRQRASNLT